MSNNLEVVCKCGKIPRTFVIFKSSKKVLKMCVRCANKRYDSLVKGHNYKVIEIKEQENNEIRS